MDNLSALEIIDKKSIGVNSPLSSALPELAISPLAKTEKTVSPVPKLINYSNIREKLKELRYKIVNIYVEKDRVRYLRLFTFLGEDILAEVDDDFKIDYSRAEKRELTQRDESFEHSSYRESLKSGINRDIYGLAVITKGNELTIMRQSSSGNLRMRYFTLHEDSSFDIRVFPLVRIKEILIEPFSIASSIKTACQLIQAQDLLNNRRILSNLEDGIDEISNYSRMLLSNYSKHLGCVKDDWIKLNEAAHNYYKLHTENKLDSEQLKDFDRITANMNIRYKDMAEDKNKLKRIRDLTEQLKRISIEISVITNELSESENKTNILI